MQTEVKRITDLDRAHYNPRIELAPDDPRYQKLKKSIAEFGLVEPIIWNVRTNRVVGGHQRLTVLTDLGHEEVTVSIVDIDEDREKALNLALNKTGGDWDNGKLAELLQDLQIAGIDIDLTGFDGSELDDLVADLGAAEAHGASWLDDLVHRQPPEPISRDDEREYEANRREENDDDQDEEEDTIAFKVPVTVTQREIILEAIKRVKVDHEEDIKRAGNEPTTAACLTYICQLFVEGKLRP